eukprot:CAMPEP_0170105314 /NCGR_PEP_ID=MMETSP0020_2-20130122/4688_1 /TAXON_ID=98059 /ORGANISM="Dinobryon sp., Strain UTEXLB2267" /LENGTH=58 /DNA_ID=CAMNT_0010329393 /DNA_START=1390 /DNA_END=1563 /DNA_ORIENTATION=+
MPDKSTSYGGFLHESTESANIRLAHALTWALSKIFPADALVDFLDTMPAIATRLTSAD